MSIGIIDIASHVPDGRRNVEAMAESFSMPEDFRVEKLGTDHLPVAAEEEDACSLAVPAVDALLKRNPGLEDRIGMLVVVTQNPVGHGLPHTAALLHAATGLGRDVAAFDLSLGCSGYVHGLEVVNRFLEGRPSDRRHGILVTSDPYSKVVDPTDRDTAMLFGDAATATLIGPDPIFEMPTADFMTDGTKSDAIAVDDGVLSMKGRKVFNFVMSNVPAQIERTLGEAGLAVADMDRFLFHQGSRYIVETLANRIGADLARTPVRIGETGNTVSSSIPLLLEHELVDESGSRLLIAGFGVGLSSGVGVLTRPQ
ncbi:MAG: 3-oxoacyl-ACP synthase [Phycisphaerae bacterium]|nr:3-oxoacyl-ACP synthase [Phycisphaerae bacterium]